MVTLCLRFYCLWIIVVHGNSSQWQRDMGSIGAHGLLKIDNKNFNRRSDHPHRHRQKHFVFANCVNVTSSEWNGAVNLGWISECHPTSTPLFDDSRTCCFRLAWNRSVLAFCVNAGAPVVLAKTIDNRIVFFYRLGHCEKTITKLINCIALRRVLASSRYSQWIVLFVDHSDGNYDSSLLVKYFHIDAREQ